MRLYRFLQGLLRVACNVFFRNIQVVGRGELPADGAVMFCGNHPNSLLDPILITAFCGRIVHFAAKDTLFDVPVMRWFLERLGAVPIRRRVDHGPGQDNRGAFDALIAVLGQGRAAGIFPEGISHDEAQLAPLKTGAARIAIAVKRRWPDLKVTLVPTGLSYLTRSRFRSSVLVQFGEGLEIGREMAALEGDAERAEVVALTSRLDQRLRALTINADSWETIRVLDGVRRLYQPPGLTLEDRVELARRFNTHYPAVRDEPAVKTLLARVGSYQQRLSALGVDDELLRRGPSVREAASRVVGHLALLGFWTPLFVIGAPIHAPLGLLFKLIGNHLAPRKDVVASTKFVAGFLGVLVVYAVLAVLAGWRWGWPAGVLAAILLPLSGHAFIHVVARVDALRHLFLTTGRILFLRKEIAALREDRTRLEAEVIAAVDRFRPADLVPKFGRDVAPA